MDNKITKKRLSDFFAYEWIAIIVAIVIFIVAWEMLYALCEVKLSVGQKFKYYYDKGVVSANSSTFYSRVVDGLSYDVISVGRETISAERDVLSDRLSIGEGDVIFTNSTENVDANKLTEDLNVRSKLIVDTCGVYHLEELLLEGQKYLKSTFFFDQYKTLDLGVQEYTKDKIDQAKVKKVFLERMKGDNRFRSQEQKETGIKQELKRVEDLCKEIVDFGVFMNYAREHDAQSQEKILYRYTMYDQAKQIAKNLGDERRVAEIEEYQKIHLAVGNRQNAPYGINLNALRGGKTNASEFAHLEGKDTAENIVMMVFNFSLDQPHLQYETITFMNMIIRDCTNGIID